MRGKPLTQDLVEEIAMQINGVCKWTEQLQSVSSLHGKTVAMPKIQAAHQLLLDEIVTLLQQQPPFLLSPEEWHPLYEKVNPEDLDNVRLDPTKSVVRWFRKPDQSKLDPSIAKLQTLMVKRERPRLVRWHEFLDKGFRPMLKQWAADLRTQKPVQRYLLSFSESHPIKSSMWLFFLLLRELSTIDPALRKDVLKKTFLVHAGTLSVQVNPDTDVVLVLDDAVYSGSQLMDEYVPHRCVMGKTRPRVHILIPYISRIGMLALQHKFPPSTSIYAQEVFRNVFDLWTPREVLETDLLHVRRYKKEKPIIVSYLVHYANKTFFLFEHKVADGISIPSWFQQEQFYYFGHYLVPSDNYTEGYARRKIQFEADWMNLPVEKLSYTQYIKFLDLLKNFEYDPSTYVLIDKEIIEEKSKLKGVRPWITSSLCPTPDKTDDSFVPCTTGLYRQQLTTAMQQLPRRVQNRFVKMGFKDAVDTAKRSKKVSAKSSSKSTKSNTKAK